MYILQKQLGNVKKLLSPNKVVVLYGPRRSGKTTLIKKLLEGQKRKFLLVNGDDIAVQKYLSSQSLTKLKSFVGRNRLLVIDEAQKIKHIGLNLKLIVDNIKGIMVVATGSSSFDLAQHVGEPLTGRKATLRLLPLSQAEIAQIEEPFATEENLQSRLLYGSYPEVVVEDDNQSRERYLKDIVSSYLYKDILELEGLRHSDKLSRLLQLLAFQIGKEVSFSELGLQLGMSKNTVEKYLDLLEKSFVLFKLIAFSRNLRKEISKSPRYYFYDNGIRNALINNFNPLELRDDVGPLWENYIVIERIKRQDYSLRTVNNYFWRTYDQKEIDYVEEARGELCGYEIKWRSKKAKAPKDWIKTYKKAKYQLITRDNYLEFIT